MSNDPFAVLGVGETDDDATVKQRYLALVRAFPPDREPDRFQEIRQAYEAVGTLRGRLAVQLLRTRSHALGQLKLALLDGERARPSAEAMTALLLDALRRVRPDRD